MPPSIRVSVREGDILTFRADVVLLKFARQFHGADYEVAKQLQRRGISLERINPSIDRWTLIRTDGGIASPFALFVGTPDLFEMNYASIRHFAAIGLDAVLAETPDVEHLAMTIHGPNFGLDETEALISQLLGLFDGLGSGVVPRRLLDISIVERAGDRCDRLQQALKTAFLGLPFSKEIPEGVEINVEKVPQARVSDSDRSRATASEAPQGHAFIAMPFAKEHDDVFYYGIQRPVQGCHLLCERIDRTAPFTGDIVERIKQKIDSAEVVIADLTGANANVYLEVGYAWGKNKDTVLVAQHGEDLKFDVRGQRCLFYGSIKDLEEKLYRELEGILANRRGRS